MRKIYTYDRGTTIKNIYLENNNFIFAFSRKVNMTILIPFYTPTFQKSLIEKFSKYKLDNKLK